MGEEFKLPASSYEELAKIIQAYGKVNEPSSNDEINKLCLIHPSTISRNSGFLLVANLIEGGQKKIATDKGKKLARAIQFENQDEVSRLWREIASENEFFSKMLSAIKIRKGMDFQSLQSHIAYSSGQGKTQYVKTGAATVVEILKIANLIEEFDGKLVAKTPEENIIEQPISPTSKEITENNTSIVIPQITKVSSTSNGSQSVNIQLKINVNVNFDELDLLGIKLRKLLVDLDGETNGNDPGSVE